MKAVNTGDTRQNVFDFVYLLLSTDKVNVTAKTLCSENIDTNIYRINSLMLKVYTTTFIAYCTKIVQNAHWFKLGSCVIPTSAGCEQGWSDDV